MTSGESLFMTLSFIMSYNSIDYLCFAGAGYIGLLFTRRLIKILVLLVGPRFGMDVTSTYEC